VEVETLRVLGEEAEAEAEAGERGFWVRKMEPCVLVWVLLRRVERRVRNCVRAGGLVGRAE
jgi:hypothetical protein